MAKINIYGELYNVTDGVIADATQVAGGYMAITEEQKANLTSAQKVNGTLVYITNGANKGNTFRYNSEISDWEEVVAEVDLTTIENKVANNEAAINTLNGDSETAGSVDKKIKDAISDLELNSESIGVNGGIIFNRDELPSDTDFNYITEPGYYYATSKYVGTYKNAPNLSGGETGGLLIVYNDPNYTSSNAVRHRWYQYFISWPSCSIYTRASVDLGLGLVEANVGPWKSISEGTAPLHIKTTLYTNDFNTVTEPGIYYITTQVPNPDISYSDYDIENIQHFPPVERREGGILFVINDNVVLTAHRLYQIYIPANGISVFRRRRLAKEIDGDGNEISSFQPWEDLSKGRYGLYSDLDLPSYPYLSYKSGNLFNGQYISNYRIAGMPEDPAPMCLRPCDESYGFNSLAVIPVKPNTMYSAIIKSAVKEHGPNIGENTEYYYFSVATATKLLGSDEPFDGQVEFKSPSEKQLSHSFQTGPNDKYAYIQTSINHHPFLQVVEGNQTQLTVSENAPDCYKAKYTFDYDMLEIEVNSDGTPSINGNECTIEPLNLFNGEYLPENFRISGGSPVDPDSFISTSQQNLQRNKDHSYGVFRMDIEPNTKYSVILDPKYGFENTSDTSTSGFFSYFKIATAKSYIDIDTFAQNTTLDGDVQLLNTGKITYSHTFTTGPNDKYLYVQTSRKLHPFVQVVKGDQTQLTTHSYNEYKITTSDGKSVIINKEPVKTGYSFYKNISAPSTTNPNNVNKNTVIITDFDNRIEYVFRKQTDNEFASDKKRGINTYRWYSMTLDSKSVFSDSDCEGAIKFKNDSDFIGGYHGDEQYEDITILVDGEEISEYKPAIRENCKNITIIVNSKVFACGTGVSKTPTAVFNRTKKLVWGENHKLTIYNKLDYADTAEREVERSAFGGLFSCYKHLLNGYSENHTYKYRKALPDSATDLSTDLSGHYTDLDEATFYCNNGMTITVKSYANTCDNDYYYAAIQNFNEQNRYKFYFDDINAGRKVRTLTKGATINQKFDITVTAN